MGSGETPYGDAHVTGASGQDEELRQALKRLVRQLVHEPDDEADGPGERLLDLLEAHLGQRPDELPVVHEDVPEYRLVDADLAMSVIAERDPGHRLVGFGGGQQRHHMTFGDQIQAARHQGGFGLGLVAQPDFVDRATGPGPEDRRHVVSLGLWLVQHDGAPVAVRQQSAAPQYGRPSGAVEVVATSRDRAEAFVAELRSLMDEHSVFGGQVVSFSGDPYGNELAGVTFLERPRLTPDQVVLPEGLLQRLDEHVLGAAAHRDVLLAHGQHLKRGVLLYGPPGTGKTHTVRYLLGASPGTTAVLLAGMSLRLVSFATRIARAHQPALVVLEDVDLVAEDRSFGHGAQPLLFEVLDALDGLDGDADVTFVLTTNRVADLERALSQRPGRVDLAAEIPLPDEEGRRRLLGLYAHGMFGEEAMAGVAATTAGTTASFAKELVRRAVLHAATRGEEPGDGHLVAAAAELMSDGQALTRSLLGAGGPDGGPGGPGPDAGQGGPGGGWFAYSPLVPRPH
ncbi:AAA family ATPase [Lapillicoccus jejuensis]|uniref:ATPase family protein associated with various cellular activities (AAA) n=1 Tax=Lapillicoccus jejuensis TaxID=402171 RepID=A0A542DXR9_9MICO|nr:ATP-binding protein [Lapillicoccus jejuensis]TQJ07865.1 ATPase family protein associated with various cellular activities (AAA) [Lapillicoccus jejuensis]